MYHIKCLYTFREDKDYLSLLDGRPISYVSKSVPLNREATSKVLRSLKPCTYEQAVKILEICKYNGNFEDYFKHI